jgi:hypothetical protein
VKVGRVVCNDEVLSWFSKPIFEQPKIIRLNCTPKGEASTNVIGALIMCAPTHGKAKAEASIQRAQANGAGEGG